MEKHWEHFPHEADMGIRGFGASKEEAFEQAALALTAVVADPKTIRPIDIVSIRCDAQEDELSLTDWLNALILEMSTRHMLFSQFKIEIKEGKLQAQAWGEKVDIQRHQPVVEVKGATYTGLKVGIETGGQWVAQCVVDV